MISPQSAGILRLDGANSALWGRVTTRPGADPYWPGPRGNKPLRLVFDEFEFCDVTLELTRDGEAVKLEPQTAAMLDLLLANRDRVVSKEELIEQIWAGRQVSDSSIENRISATRSAVGDSGREQKRIKTFPNRGFRFVGQVEVLDPAVDATSPLEPVPEAKAPWYRVHSRILTSAVTVLIGAVAIPLLSDGFFQSNETAEASRSINDEFRASIAVMPFRDLSTDGDQANLAEGIAVELSGILSQVKDLKVSSRTSTFLLAERETASIPEIGEKLGVEHVLEGSVRQDGDALRIDVQLVEVGADRAIWSKTFEPDQGTNNLLQIQEQMASAILIEVMGELQPQGLEPAANTTSNEAYELYLEAQALIQKGARDATFEAIAKLEKAIELDPNFSQAHGELAFAYYDSFHHAPPDADWGARIEEHATKARQLAPDDPVSLYAAGLLAGRQDDHDQAIKFLQQAIAKDPNNSTTLQLLARAYRLVGRHEEHANALRKARQIDPLAPVLLSGLGLAEFNLGNVDEALEIARDNLRLNPDSIDAQSLLAEFLMRAGKLNAAHKRYLEVQRINPEFYAMVWDLTGLYREVGMNAEALDIAKTRRIFEALHAGATRDADTVNGFIEEGSILRAPDDLGKMLYGIGELDRAVPYVRQVVKEHEIAGPAKIGLHEMVWEIHHAFVLRHAGDPDGTVILEKLEEAIEGQTPQIATVRDVFLVGAATRMMRGDKAGAITWFDAAIDQGHVFLNSIQEPLFEPLLKEPAFKSRLERMEAMAADYRAQFREDLAETNTD